MERWRIAALIVVAACIAGFAFGFYYYYPQLQRLNPITWLFVMDSPMAVLLFGLAILAPLLGRRQEWLIDLAGITCLKVGIWTLFVIVYLGDYFLAPQRANWYYLLAGLHVLMVLAGLWALGGVRANSLRLTAGIFVWLVFNDVMDYAFGLHPDLPAVSYELNVIFAVTLALSAIAVLWFYWAGRRGANLLGWLPIFGDELRQRIMP